jgi:acetyl esterase/lipase
MSGAVATLARIRDFAWPWRETELARVFNLVASEPGIAVREGLSYGPDARRRLDVYEAASRPADAPVVLYLYGGGWREGAREKYRFLGTALAARGVTAIVPDYRLYPAVRFPAFVNDAACAYNWVCAHFGGRPVVLMGHSAGAHIAALLALDPCYRARFAPRAPAPAGLIGLAGPYAFDPTTWGATRDIFAPAASHPEKARPVAQARRPDAPPSLLLYGLADATVARFNGLDLFHALAREGASARLIEYAGIGHVGIVTAIGRGLRWRAPVLRDALRFIRGLPR